ncbi:MAG: enolase C-terminal domain-like protein [Spirochaetales bacterium]
MPVVTSLCALEILDSRGRPTLKATCVLASGARGTASVPSGASTGAAEARELRDGDEKRYHGLGCLKAVGHVNNELNRALANRSFASQQDLDAALVGLDGTADKSRLGANALLAVSLAFARAAAAEQAIPLYGYFALVAGRKPDSLPRLTVNLFSGGLHAGGQVAIQDVLMVPQAATIGASLEMTAAVYRSAAELTLEHYGMRELKADEGGLAPPFASSRAMLDEAVLAIRAAGLEPGKDVALAVDVASSQFYRDNLYHLDGQTLDGPAMVRRLQTWLEDFPILSIEDPLAQEDWLHWSQFRREVASDILVMGDDLLCTKVARIQKAIDTKAASALLLKVNQIGTVTEACEALHLARSAGWSITVSARSGETEDDWLADLAVGWGADYLKVGSIRQSERLAKYNRLLEIEAQTGLPVRPL